MTTTMHEILKLKHPEPLKLETGFCFPGHRAFVSLLPTRCWLGIGPRHWRRSFIGTAILYRSKLALKYPYPIGAWRSKT